MIRGASVKDVILGFDGNDHPFGRLGNDWLEGGPGNDARFSVGYQVQGSAVLVQIDLDHDTTANLSLLLYNTASLTAADFLL